MRRLLGFVLSGVLLGVGLNLRVTAQERQPEPLRKRGAATEEETRPAHFPHRIWAACDFKGQTPDYAWFGPTQTKNIPNYPGNITALGVKEKPYRNLSALMTGINAKSKPKYWPGGLDIVTKSKGAPDDSYCGVARSVPHAKTHEPWMRLQIAPPRPVGDQTKLRFRYFLSRASAMTVQVFDATDQDNRHIHLTRLTSGAWQWAILDFTNDAKRNDGQQTPFAAGHKVDDLFFFVKPEPGQEAQLFVDEVTLFDAGKP